MAEISLRDYLQKLNTLLQRKDYDAVIHHCRQILRQYPKHAETYNVLGNALIGAKRWQEAGDIYYRLLGVYPANSQLHLNLGYVCDRLRLPNKAAWHYNRVIDHYPDRTDIVKRAQKLSRVSGVGSPSPNYLTRESVAWRLYDEGRFRDAVDVINELITHDPNRIDLQLLMANAMWHESRHVDSAEHALDILTKFPYCLDANKILARLWLKQNRDRSADRYIRRIREVNPYYASELTTGEEPKHYAYTLEELGDYELKQEQEQRQATVIRGIRDLLPDNWHRHIEHQGTWWIPVGDNRIAESVRDDEQIISELSDTELIDVNELMNILEKEELHDVASRNDNEISAAGEMYTTSKIKDTISNEESLQNINISSNNEANESYSANIIKTSLVSDVMSDSNNDKIHPESESQPTSGSSLLDHDPEIYLEPLDDDEFVDFTESFSIKSLSLEDYKKQAANDAAVDTQETADLISEEEDTGDEVDAPVAEALVVGEILDEEVAEIADEDEAEMEPADNAPDWLNAMVPGMDVDYDADEDAPTEQEYLGSDDYSLENGEMAEAPQFEWLNEIVAEEESQIISPYPDSGLQFTQLPIWLRRVIDNGGNMDEFAAASVATAVAMEADMEIDEYDLETDLVEDEMSGDTREIGVIDDEDTLADSEAIPMAQITEDISEEVDDELVMLDEEETSNSENYDNFLDWLNDDDMTFDGDADDPAKKPGPPSE